MVRKILGLAPSISRLILGRFDGGGEGGGAPKEGARGAAEDDDADEDK